MNNTNKSAEALPEIKRYALTYRNDFNDKYGADRDEDEEGEYVTYDDHATIVAKLQATILADRNSLNEREEEPARAAVPVQSVEEDGHLHELLSDFYNAEVGDHIDRRTALIAHIKSLLAARPSAAPADSPAAEKAGDLSEPHWIDGPQTALGGKSAREGYEANPEYNSPAAGCHKIERENANGNFGHDSLGAAVPALDRNYVQVGEMNNNPTAAAAGYLSQHIPGNFTTHRAAWRDAIAACIGIEAASGNADKADYWKHELAAYDRAFARLLDKPEAVRPAAVGAVDREATDKELGIRVDVHDAALEAAANACDKLTAYHKETRRHVLATVAEKCAFDIRALRSQSKGE